MAKATQPAAPADTVGPTGNAFTPAPDTAPASVATGAPAGNPNAGVKDAAMDHPVVHRPRNATAPYQP